MKTEPTEADFDNLLTRLKAKDEYFEQRSEFGKLLMININDFTEGQRLRYLELRESLSDKPFPSTKP